ncbi:uncharacterized protein METZ01_LOCUS170984, partial [marine metagenome]
MVPGHDATGDQTRVGSRISLSACSAPHISL